MSGDFLHPLFLSFPFHDPLVALLPRSLNLQSYFRHEWIYFELAALLRLYAVNNHPLAFIARKCFPPATADGVARCDAISIYLDIIVHEKIDVFMDRQVHRHLIDCVLSCTLNGVFDSALLEDIVPVLLGGR